MINKISGGSSSILINLAVAYGGVAMVYAIGSAQFVFVLILALFASMKYPDIFEEKLYFWDWAQKVGAIVMIAVGTFLVYSVV